MWHDACALRRRVTRSCWEQSWERRAPKTWREKRHLLREENWHLSWELSDLFCVCCCCNLFFFIDIKIWFDWVFTCRFTGTHRCCLTTFLTTSVRRSLLRHQAGMWEVLRVWLSCAGVLLCARCCVFQDCEGSARSAWQSRYPCANRKWVLVECRSLPRQTMIETVSAQRFCRRSTGRHLPSVCWLVRGPGRCPADEPYRWLIESQLDLPPSGLRCLCP